MRDLSTFVCVFFLYLPVHFFKILILYSQLEIIYLWLSSSYLFFLIIGQGRVNQLGGYVLQKYINNNK